MRWVWCASTLGAVLGINAVFPGASLANGGPVAVTSPGASQVGTIVPLKSRQIALVAEDVKLDILMHYTVGRVRYRLQNQGGPTSVRFGFPTLVFEGHYQGKVTGDYLQYAIRVDGRSISAVRKLGRKLTRTEVMRLAFPDLFKRGGPDLPNQASMWTGGDVNKRLARTRRMYRISRIRFKRGQTRRVEITFVAPNHFQMRSRKHFVSDGYSYVSYLTRPARRWKGRIRKARFRFRVHGRPRRRGHSLPGIQVYPKPHRTTKAGYEWTYKNWLPKKNFRVLVAFSAKRGFKALWRATFRAIEQVYGQRLAARSLKRTVVRWRNGRQQRLRRPYSLPRRLRWFLSDQRLGVSGSQGDGPSLDFRLRKPRCVRGIAVLQSARSNVWQPRRLELTGDGGLKETIRLRKDTSLAPGLGWVGVQVKLFRQPARVSRLKLRIRTSYPAYKPNGRMEIQRLGFIRARRGACRRSRSKSSVRDAGL